MIQTIKYKCCGKIFAACCEPESYTDSDWLKSLKQYVKRGDNDPAACCQCGIRKINLQTKIKHNGKRKFE